MYVNEITTIEAILAILMCFGVGYVLGRLGRGEAWSDGFKNGFEARESHENEMRSVDEENT